MLQMSSHGPDTIMDVDETHDLLLDFSSASMTVVGFPLCYMLFPHPTHSVCEAEALYPAVE